LTPPFGGRRAQKQAKPGGEPNKLQKGEKSMKTLVVGILLTWILAPLAWGQEMTVPMYLLTKEGTGKQIGTVTLKDTRYGLLLLPALSGLKPGIHGFHVHQNPDCGPAKESGKMVPGLAAGGHYDPGNTGRHEGPYGEGHLGDLPALPVDGKGKARLPLLAPRLKLDEVKGHALIIHAGGDNYSDQPKKLGGGGARVACGVLK
jgi:Cu-Zn family superoxide dismutase